MTTYNSAFDLLDLTDADKQLIEIKTDLMLNIRDYLNDNPEKKKDADQEMVDLIYSGKVSKLTLDTLVLMAVNYKLPVPEL